eukprot:jgi/Chlat1/4771/Chrsp308S00822
MAATGEEAIGGEWHAEQQVAASPPVSDGDGDDAVERIRREVAEAVAEGAADQDYDYNGALKAAASKPLRVVAVEIDGLQRTRREIVERELMPVLEASSFEELKDSVLDASHRLKDLEIFTMCDILIDEGPEIPGLDTATVIITVQEAGPLSLNTGTYVQGGEGSVEGKLTLLNHYGTAEKLEVEASVGGLSTNRFAVALMQPRPGGADCKLTWRLFQDSRSMKRHSSFNEKFRGGSVSLSSHEHELGYGLTWRNISAATRQASPCILQCGGDSLKSSLLYTHMLDYRDSAVAPSMGWALRATTELAGLGFDSRLTRFIAQKVETQYNLPLTEWATLMLGGSAGMMLPWAFNGFSRPSIICDRYFLGGPGSLRGFRTKGVGPSDARRLIPRQENEEAATEEERRHRAGHDRLGGDAVFTAYASLNFILPHPYLEMLGIHGHVFANAGQLVQLTGPAAAYRSGDPAWFSNVVKSFLDNMRVSVGAGLVFPTRFGRLEANLCQVLRMCPGDSPKTGIQLGFSSNFG